MYSWLIFVILKLFSLLVEFLTPIPPITSRQDSSDRSDGGSKDDKLEGQPSVDEADKLDVFSPWFDPLTAIYSPEIVLPDPNASVFESVDSFIEEYESSKKWKQLETTVRKLERQMKDKINNNACTKYGFWLLHFESPKI